jgi:hypothetical protein
MKCFFQSSSCRGVVRPAEGAADSSWLNGALDRESGYCVAHRLGNLDRARWEEVHKGQSKGKVAE